MIGVSTALAGVPPTGLGVYAWRGSIPEGPWAWFAVDARHASVLEAAKRRGPVWLFRGPSAWGPASWRATLAELVAMAEPITSGYAGILANPEGGDGWQNAPEAEFRAFGAALRAAALRTRVGIVTVPSWRGLGIVADEAGRAVWWSIELYARSTPPASFAGWWARWRALVGPRLIPTIAAFVPNTDLGREWISPARYREYLAAMPQAGGAIAWEGGVTEWMRAGLADRYGSSGISTRAFALPWAAVSVSDTWIGMAAILAALVVALLALAREKGWL